MGGQVVRWVSAGVGATMVLGTATTVFQILVLARRRTSYEAKDRLLAQVGLLTLLTLLLVWLFPFHVGDMLILWPLAGGPLQEVFREVGSSLFTLGFASRAAIDATALDFVAAVTGLVVVALQIAYLAVVHGAFSKRETFVTMLQSRAGSPARAQEILARHPVLLYFRSPLYHALHDDGAPSETRLCLRMGFTSRRCATSPM